MTKRDKLRYSLTKHPYYKVLYPQNIQTGESIKGWWIKDVPEGFCTCQNPCEMNSCGWFQVLFCFLFFWPCSILPCFLSSNYDGYQIPDFDGQPRRTIIYTTPYNKNQNNLNPNTIPVATPISNE